MSMMKNIRGISLLGLRGLLHVGLDHSVADEPGQRAVIKGAQTKVRRLALRASLRTHHLVTASPKNDDSSRQQSNSSRLVH